MSLGGKKKSEPGTEPILQMKNICVQDQGRELLKDISLEVRRGEILGIAGIDGSGQDILVDVINGSLRPKKGTILLGGNDMGNARPDKRRADGIGIIPQDRHRHGLALDFPLRKTWCSAIRETSGMRAGGLSISENAGNGPGRR